MKDSKLNGIWAISLMVLSVLSLIIGSISIVGLEIPHIFRMIIAVIQLVLGIVVIVATVLKLKK